MEIEAKGEQGEKRKGKVIHEKHNISITTRT
jgi:hypothetical protein